MRFCHLLVLVFAATPLAAQQPAALPSAPSTALTIYNEDFAVARTQVDLDLHPGLNEVTTNHTPTEETVKVSTSSAFDIKGSRRQTDFSIDQNRHTLKESFEIKLTNQKPAPVEVNVIENLYRGDNWEIQDKSTGFTKVDSHTIQFPVQVPAKGEAILTYVVRYTW